MPRKAIIHYEDPWAFGSMSICGVYTPLRLVQSWRKVDCKNCLRIHIHNEKMKKGKSNAA